MEPGLRIQLEKAYNVREEIVVVKRAEVSYPRDLEDLPESIT
jgi:hypothetical protein